MRSLVQQVSVQQDLFLSPKTESKNKLYCVTLEIHPSSYHKEQIFLWSQVKIMIADCYCNSLLKSTFPQLTFILENQILTAKKQRATIIAQG